MRNYKLFTLLFIMLLVVIDTNTAKAQHGLSGAFTSHAGEEIRLKGFNGFEEIVFSQDTISEDGGFKLSYPENYRGMGMLEIKKQGSLLLILVNEKNNIQGTHIQDLEHIEFINSQENKYFDTYVQEQRVRGAKLDGWKWLKPLYAAEDSTTEVYTYINQEIQALQYEETAFLQGIPQKYYASYYLPLRKLIEDRPISANRYIERIPEHVRDFKTYKLADVKLLQSGLMEEFYDGHFVMLENVHGISDEGYAIMYESIDHILDQLMGYDEVLLEVSEHLFKLFEKRSLFPAAEYLSFKMLEQNGCAVNGELKRRFEQYRTMKEGNKAPDIVFENNETNMLRGFENGENSLYKIQGKYKVVVFWASWCEHCMEELPQLESLYSKLEEKNVEVIGVSLDKNRQAFMSAIGGQKWRNYCDFNEWESQPVLDYFVFSTPSMYLLDENNTILKKIISVAQLEAIVESYL